MSCELWDSGGVRRFCCLSCFLLAPNLFGAHGTFEALDGKTYRGQIRIAESGFVVANATEEYVIEIPATNLSRILFVDRKSETLTALALVHTNADASLPAPWQSEDLGSVRAPGQASWQAGVFTIKSGGNNLGSQSDSLHFVYQAMHGDCDVIARITTLQPREPKPATANDYSAPPKPNVGLMIRESLKVEAASVMVGLSGGRRGAFQKREASGELSRVEADSTLRLWQWLRLKRRDNTISAYNSGNGRGWRFIDSVEIPMGEKIYVGLALAGTNDAKLASATLDGVRIGEFLVDASIVPRVEARSGSVLVGQFESADERVIRFADHPGLHSVATENVARILFRWLTPKLEDKVKAHRPGVVLANGDFVEGDFKGIHRGQVRISSVLLGLRTFEVDEITAIILRHPLKTETVYRIELRNKSLLQADSIRAGNGDLVVRDAALGDVRIATEELSEIKRMPKRDRGLAQDETETAPLAQHQMISIASP